MDRAPSIDRPASDAPSPRAVAPHPGNTVRRLAVHGLTVTLRCDVPALDAAVARMLGEFEVDALPPGFMPISGTVRPYEASEVVASLSPQARRVESASRYQPGPDEPAELYEDGDRLWVVDERWGIAELNPVKGSWRSWLLPQPRLDVPRCVDAAVLWPMAQLLRRRGLHLLPAASAVRAGQGVMIIAPFDVGPELAALVRAGYKLVGQRWTAVRTASDAPAAAPVGASRHGGPIELLRMPGWVERAADSLVAPRTRAGASPATSSAPRRPVDLTLEHCGAAAAHAYCGDVLVVSPARRAASGVRRLTSPDEALQLLRAAWPLAELHAQRGGAGQLAHRLAQRCGVYELALSREPRDLPDLLARLPAHERPAVAVSLHLPSHRPSTRAAVAAVPATRRAG